jgi:hypothetical protein
VDRVQPEFHEEPRMKILAIDKVREDATPDVIRANFLKEVAHTIKMYLADVVREVYFRQDRSGTVMVLEAPSMEEAQSLINTLPLVKQGQIEFELIPLGPYVPLGLLVEEADGPAEETAAGPAQ